MSQIVNTIFSSLTVVAQILIVMAILGVVIRQNNWILRFFKKHGLALAFTTATLALLGSLTYSDVLGYEPCKLCWYQRIFMYPQVLLLGLALFYKQKREVIMTSIVLSSIGAFIAASHYLLQTTGIDILSCGAVGYSSSCAQRFVMNFGYITIPLMALSAFLLMITGLSLYKKDGATNLEVEAKILL